MRRTADLPLYATLRDCGRRRFFKVREAEG
jgi:hypothetical protein